MTDSKPTPLPETIFDRNKEHLENMLRQALVEEMWAGMDIWRRWGVDRVRKRNRKRDNQEEVQDGTDSERSSR